VCADFLRFHLVESSLVQVHVKARGNHVFRQLIYLLKRHVAHFFGEKLWNADTKQRMLCGCHLLDEQEVSSVECNDVFLERLMHLWPLWLCWLKSGLTIYEDGLVAAQVEFRQVEFYAVRKSAKRLAAPGFCAFPAGSLPPIPVRGRTSLLKLAWRCLERTP